MRKALLCGGLALAFLVLPLTAQKSDQVDLDAVYKIKREAVNNSRVMDTLSYITDVYGGRLTGSTNTKLAGDWVIKQMQDWGLANPHYEYWDFGRGWVNERFYANVTSPVTYPLIAYPLAWTPGTSGPVTGEVVIVGVKNPNNPNAAPTMPVTEDAADALIASLKGTLKGKIVMLDPPREIAMSTEPLAHRYTQAELDEMGMQEIGGRRGGAAPAFNALTPQMQAAANAVAQRIRAKLNNLFLSEGVAAVFQEGRGDGGTVYVQSAAGVVPVPPPGQGGGRGGRGPSVYASQNAPPALNQVMLAAEHYNRIYRTLQKNVPVTVELNIQNKFLDNDGGKSFDIVGEIPGSDPRLRDQIVMIGGHFDSWHSGTGATDNGVGSAVMLEVMRVLKASGLNMRRTVRIGLWTGEEEGLLGSRAYVTDHFGRCNTETGAWELKQPAHDKFSVYFNIDNGSGKLRGVYLQGNEAARPVFQEWMKPFESMGMNTISISNTGGTDHLSYDAVGLPGFQFIQDPLEYDTRTHHSNMDLWDRVQDGDLRQMATIVSTFVYQAANRDMMFPRKPQAPCTVAGGGRRGGM
ncbi:MAG TPA: M28 family peptidase [Candidatus Acidoferrales bacterium]|nr:M28 family peptidase [Candidatus Acidoferrales bacterium]